MHSLIKNTVLLSALSLMGCGGGSGGSTTPTPTANTGAVLTVSSTNLSFSGKQFDELVPTQRVNLTYDSDVVSIVSMIITGDSEFEGRNVFNVSSDSSNTFADIGVDNSDIEGGTYVDTLVLRPSLRAGGFGDSITVDLTLVQEATSPITAEVNDPTVAIEIVDGGPPVRVAASLNTGNTIRWEVGPYRFTADDVDAVTTDPTEGVGSEQVDIVITPTQTLIDSIRTNGSEFANVGFQDRDHPGNFAELVLEITLAE